MKYFRTITMILVLFTLPGLCFSAGMKGKTAPGFALKNIKGKTVTLKGLRAKGYVMIVFWGPQCVYCLSHVHDFNALKKKYRGKLTIVAISFAGELIGDIKEYIDNYGPKYMFLVDRLKNIDVANAYKVKGSPTIVLVSPAGKVVFYGYKTPNITRWIK